MLYLSHVISLNPYQYPPLQILVPMNFITQNVHRNMTTKSSNGREFYLIEVIAFVLKFLKNELEHHMENLVSLLKGTDFDWVVTVPAIWKARGKRMMREAAYMVGIVVYC